MSNEKRLSNEEVEELVSKNNRWITDGLMILAFIAFCYGMGTL
jgi:hypothetical protein